MFYSETNPRGQKEYSCYLCVRSIHVGEEHAKICGTTDGDFWSMRTHLKCREKTQGWGQEEWEYHEYIEFRKYCLNETNEGAK